VFLWSTGVGESKSTIMQGLFQHETERVDVNADTLSPKLLESFIM
jgi:hypothetical protein